MLHNYITMHGAKNIKSPKVGTGLSVKSPVLFCNTCYTNIYVVAKRFYSVVSFSDPRAGLLRMQCAEIICVNKLKLKYIYIYLN